MTNFSTYGVVFEVPDRYLAGHVMTENEAAALNRNMAEMISHRVRSGALADVSKGMEPTPDQIAAANELIAQIAPTFEFGAGRGEGAVVLDPIGKEARLIARAEVKRAIAASGKTLGKKDAEPLEGVYCHSKYEAKVEMVRLMPKVLAAAKKIVASRSVDADALGIEV
jgi:hypothetical protein